VKILHVDDREEWLEGVRKKVLELSSIKGLRVLRAMSCEEAFQRLEQDKPHALIQDLFMKSGDPDRLFEEERLQAFDVIARAAEDQIPCIILSNVGKLKRGQTAEQFQRELLNRTGAKAYVTKEAYVETGGKALVAQLEKVLGAA